MPRYPIAAFPAFAAISAKAGPRLTIVLALVFAIGQIGLASFAFVAIPRLAP